MPQRDQYCPSKFYSERVKNPITYLDNYRTSTPVRNIVKDIFNKPLLNGVGGSENNILNL